MVVKRDPVVFAANARREIQRAFEQLLIFKRPRATALLHFATVTDVQAIAALKSPFEDAPSSNMAHRQAVESSAFAIPGIYKFCSPEATSNLCFDKQIYMEAWQLFDFCYKYEQIDFSYKLADKGQLRIYVPKREPRVTFAYTDKSADEAETALRARELEVVFTGEQLNLDMKAQLELFGALTETMRARIRCKEQQCDYSLGPNEIELMRKLGMEMVKTFPVEMDARASVAGVTFGELRAYWGAILSISNVHFMAHHLCTGGDLSKWPLETTAMRKSRRCLVTSISEISGLPPELVESIAGWYVYDPRVSNRCPILQPFLPLEGDTLCLPFLFVNGNSMERNFFKLMHRHPTLRPLAQLVVEMKEPVALRELESLFPSAKYKTRQCVEIPGVTDADLLVYELESGFLFVIQHKWPGAPETVEESWANDAKLLEGVKQAVEARDALRSDPSLARRALRLLDTQPINRIEAVTVCRGFEHTGFVGPTSVPVITEVSFRALHIKAQSLENLWSVLNSRPDLQKAGERVKEFRWKLQLAGLEFVMPGLKY
jgi:hypothetical protein